MNFITHKKDYNIFFLFTCSFTWITLNTLDPKILKTHRRPPLIVHSNATIKKDNWPWVLLSSSTATILVFESFNMPPNTQEPTFRPVEIFLTSRQDPFACHACFKSVNMPPNNGKSKKLIYIKFYFKMFKKYHRLFNTNMLIILWVQCVGLFRFRNKPLTFDYKLYYALDN